MAHGGEARRDPLWDAYGRQAELSPSAGRGLYQQEDSIRV